MDNNRRVSETLAVVGVLNPVSQSTGESLTAAIDTKLYRRLFAVIQIGAVGAAGTVDATWKASTTSGGTYSAVGTAITQATVANKVIKVELDCASILTTNRFVKLSVTVGANAVLTSAIVYGVPCRYEPASAQDAAAVAQTVVSA